MSFDTDFIARSHHFLVEEYLPKIERCVAEMSAEDIWWRPNPASNSLGNLLLHLAGNLRQWVVSGVGGETDRRDRPEEFAAEGNRNGDELIASLRATVAEADAVLARLAPARLTEPAHIQGRDVTVGGAIYHAVEHFGMHTGQIILLTKLRTGRDLQFYRLEEGIPRPNWSSQSR